MGTCITDVRTQVGVLEPRGTRPCPARGPPRRSRAGAHFHIFPVLLVGVGSPEPPVSSIQCRTAGVAMSGGVGEPERPRGMSGRVWAHDPKALLLP